LNQMEVFSVVPDHIGDEHLNFPAGWTIEKVKNLARFLDEDRRATGVRALAETDAWAIKHATSNAQYVQAMRSRRVQRRDQRGMCSKQARKQRALLDERLALVSSYLVPARRRVLERLSRDSARDSWDVLATKSECGLNGLADLFPKMPLLDQHARLYAQDAMEVERVPEHQDFFDVDHGSIPPIFSDAFVTLDHRLANFVQHAGRGRATILRSLEDLARWINRS
jgi:hypothetical protein